MFLDGDGDGFSAALCAKLAADGVDMLIHGIRGDVEYVVRMRTRVSGSASRIRRVASTPSITGMEISITTTSGFSSRAAFTASRSTSFRSGAFGVGDRYCPPLHGRVGGTSAHPHSASDSSFGVVLRIRAHMRPHGLGRNTSRKPCATPLHPSAQSRLSPESPAPWMMRLVRPRC